MELTLTKTRHYKLEPYGKFVIKWKTRQRHIPNIIPIDELEIYYDTTYPMSEEQDKKVIALMKKHKTDILTDGSYFGFYTRISGGLTMVRHKKFFEYRDNLVFKNAVDSGRS